MFRKILYTFIFFLICSPCFAARDYMDAYCIAWRDLGAGSTTNTGRYAQSMGYKYIALRDSASAPTTFGTGTYKNAYYDGLNFYIVNPMNWSTYKRLGFNRVGTSGANAWSSRTAAQQNFCKDYMAFIGSSTDYTTELSAGWRFSDGSNTLLWDLQQARARTIIVDDIVAYALDYQNSVTSGTMTFTFAGYLLDVARLFGDVHEHEGELNTQTTFAYWNGTDTCAIHTDSAGQIIVHDMATYSDGTAQLHKDLKVALDNNFGTGTWHWGVEPWKIWVNPSTDTDEYVYEVSLRGDKAQLIPDMVFQEGNSLRFGNEFPTYAPLIGLNRNQIGCSQQDSRGESFERQVAIMAGTSTANLRWFGHFGTSPNYDTITEIADRHKLIRWIPNQDNLILVDTNGDLLSTSTTRFAGTDNGTASYHSEDTNEGNRWNSYISNKIYWGRDHRKSSRTIYACFLENSNMGTVTIPAGDGVIRVFSVNDYYERNTDITSQFTFTNNVLQPVSTFSVNTGSGTGVIIETGPKGRMYCEY